MKILILQIVLISSFFSSAFAADDPSISNFERGIICKAIGSRYPKMLPSDSGPGWLSCRSAAAFMRIQDYYGVIMNLGHKNLMSCSARLSEGPSKSPYATVNCKIYEPKRK